MSNDFLSFTAHEARLFPTAHITSAREAEIRATASVLAMVRAVSEFGRSIVRLAGGPAGKIGSYTEVPFELQRRGKSPEAIRPDGIISSLRAKKEWAALVEVKVGANPLDPDQVEKYHHLARQERFDALVTISNEPARPGGLPPVRLDGRRLRSIPVVHFSWEHLLSEAQMLSRKKAISDPDQKWMLDEWILYVDNPASRILEPPDLGTYWRAVLNSAKTGSLVANSPELRDVVENWIGYLQRISLRMRAKLGAEVRMRLRKTDREVPEMHIQRLAEQACAKGMLSGTMQVPDAAGNLRTELFLHSKTVRHLITIRAPTSGRQATRLNWLAKQLRRSPELPEDLRVTVKWDKRGMTSAARGEQVIADAGALLFEENGSRISRARIPRSFEVEVVSGFPRGKGRGSAALLDGISHDVTDFYRSVVEQIVPYVPPAPRLPEHQTSMTAKDPRKADL